MRENKEEKKRRVSEREYIYKLIKYYIELNNKQNTKKECGKCGKFKTIFHLFCCLIFLSVEQKKKDIQREHKTTTTNSV